MGKGKADRPAGAEAVAAVGKSADEIERELASLARSLGDAIASVVSTIEAIVALSGPGPRPRWWCRLWLGSRWHAFRVHDLGRFKVRTCRSCGRIERRIGGRWRWWPLVIRWWTDNRGPDARLSRQIRDHRARGTRR